MKGSTLKRSNLSKEKIAMIEALAKYKSSFNQQELVPGIDKQDALDLLWQNFKVASKAERPPMAYFTAGVFIGVVSTLLVAILVSFIAGYSPFDEMNISVPKTIQAPKEKLNFSFIPADTKDEVEIKEEVAPETKEYTVQAGDSLEGIAIKFYGSFDETKIKAIEKANNLANPDAIGIGQKLIIPMN